MNTILEGLDFADDVCLYNKKSKKHAKQNIETMCDCSIWRFKDKHTNDKDKKPKWQNKKTNNNTRKTIDKVLNFGTNRHNKQNHKNTELKFKTESPLTCYVLLLVKIIKFFVKQSTLWFNLNL